MLFNKIIALTCNYRNRNLKYQKTNMKMLNLIILNCFVSIVPKNVTNRFQIQMALRNLNCNINAKT